MATKLFLGGRYQLIDNAGVPANGGLIYFYTVGTTSLKDTYLDKDLLTKNTNPVVTDSNGWATIFLDGDYKAIATNSDGSVIYYTQDGGINPVNPVITTYYDNIAALRALETAPNGVFEIKGYYLDGDGGGGTFYWDSASTDTDNNGTIIKITAIATGRCIRMHSSIIDLRWFGVVGTATAAVNTLLFQDAITYVCNNDLVLHNTINSFASNQVTTPDSTTFTMVGDAQGFKALTTNKVSEIVFTGTASTVEYMIVTGTHTHITIIGMVFSTSDNTEQWGIIQAAVLGAGNGDQSSADGQFLIEDNSFHDVGGTCASLGGEMYGDFHRNTATKVAQLLAVNGAGEFAFRNNQWENIINSSFTPEANNYDACIYIKGTNTKIKENVYADSNDNRDVIYLDNCGGIDLTGNKMEFPGITAPANDIISVYNTTTQCKFLRIVGNPIVRSSTLSGGFAGRMIRTTGTPGAIHNCSLRDNEFAYGATTPNTVSAVDFTVNPPRKIAISNNMRESSSNPMIHLADGHVSVSEQHTMFGGLSGEDIQYITVQSRDFAVSASQTGTTVPFDMRNHATWFADNLTQMLPVSMTIQCTTDPLDTVTFYHELDTGKLDTCVIASATTDFTNQTRFALRTVYMRTPSTSSATNHRFFYDSGASTSTSVLFRITYIMAIIQDPETTNSGKHLIDVI